MVAGVASAVGDIDDGRFKRGAGPLIDRLLAVVTFTLHRAAMIRVSLASFTTVITCSFENETACIQPNNSAERDAAAKRAKEYKKNRDEKKRRKVAERIRKEPHGLIATLITPSRRSPNI
jgi:hypothetical protein